MNDPAGKVIDLIFGRWRSQILYTGVKLGVFDALANCPRSAVSLATEFDLDPGKNRPPLLLLQQSRNNRPSLPL